MANDTRDLLAKVDALQARGRVKRVEEEQAAKVDRRELWGRLQKESPDTAAALVRVNELFGKPTTLAVKFDSDGVWIEVK